MLNSQLEMHMSMLENPDDPFDSGSSDNGGEIGELQQNLRMHHDNEIALPFIFIGTDTPFRVIAASIIVFTVICNFPNDPCSQILMAATVILMSHTFLETASQDKATAINSTTKTVAGDVDHRQHEAIEPIRKARIEANRLLGLIGAPPLRGLQLDHSHFTAVGQQLQVDSDAFQSVFSISAFDHTTVIHFVRSQALLILAVDKVYDWLRRTTSLHLGLGPQSQCTERVELTMIGRDLQQQKYPAERTTETRMHLQKGLPKALCLMNIRSTVGQQIINQLHRLEIIADLLHEKEIYNDTSMCQDDWADVKSSLAAESDLPDVIMLTWIKNTRREVASILSLVVEGLLDPTQTTGHAQHRNSDWHLQVSPILKGLSQHAKEGVTYLNAIILCDDDVNNVDGIDDRLKHSSEQEMIPSSLHHDSIFQSLIHLEHQVGAWQASLWACHRNMINDLGDSNGPESLLYWWTKGRELGDTIHTIEQGISSALLQRSANISETSDESDDDTEAIASTGGVPTDMIERFEHFEPCSDPTTKTSDSSGPKKIHVFAGDGIKRKPATKYAVGKFKSESSGLTSVAATAPLKRDQMAEQLLVKELQNRIKILEPLEEEIRTDLTANRPDDTSSNNYIGGIGRNKTTMPPQESSSRMNAKRNVAMPLFLGASGSLLQELQKSLSANANSTAEANIIEPKDL